MMNSNYSWARVVAPLVLMACSPLATGIAKAQQVYIGSANGWDAMIAQPKQWKYVRTHADGFYVNFIQMLNPSAQKCAKTSALFKHKNAYYESDSRYTGLGGFPDGGQFSRALQSQELFALLNGGFKVPYTSLNYGVDDVKLADLKGLGLPPGVTRPCFAQNGPWTFGGGIMKDQGENARMRADTARTDGASTDGPLSLWQADQGGMRNGSYSVVKYAHSLHKTAAVMVAPYDLKPTSQWLSAAQECVRQHEDAGAVPDIWIVFEYATSTPTLPETQNGQPADTITGMAYWLLHHLKDPDHAAKLNVAAPPQMTHTALGSSRTFNCTLENDSSWLDLCPVVRATLKAPGGHWTARYTLDGRDVTQAMTRGGGLVCVGSQRLLPKSKHMLQVTLSGPKATEPADVVLELMSHPTQMQQVHQRLVLHAPALPSPAQKRLVL